ncbi:MAG: mycothiol system anti-sigma-R factor [Propionibacteriaceae bacterium]|nr:mycothiol system anti-sigma-R factor [Micropruina sp.]HBX80435.1 mycothiol system anti-sigma-R factor [Propionibacteriaceae bacterium]HBY23605.1 mycothiol system anti-sigma-R factor [Propionibacteriaceae bacterium]
MSEALHDDDCSAILARAYVFLDHELSEAEEDDVRAHLMACEPCLDHFDVEAAVKALVKRCCTEEAKAPEGLRARIVTTFTSYTRTTIIREA